jgi:hypothetical protein
MTQHITEHLSAYLDEELDARERATIDAHVRVCADCAADLDDMRRLVAYARTVAAQDVPPSRDLWSGIRARIEDRGADVTDGRNGAVAQFQPRAESRATPRHASAAAATFEQRRISMSIVQLAAAAVLLMAVSGATAWFLRGSAPVNPVSVDAPSIQAEVEPTAPSGEVRLVNFADAQYDAAVSDLERALDERRNDLNPRTVEILERNLKLIDAAIAQARQALEEDPGNTYLNRHLVESRRRKLDLLRRATAITEGD